MGEGKTVEVCGCHTKGKGNVSKEEVWKAICAKYRKEFPQIHKCFRGTFNVKLADGEEYTPPGDAGYKKRGAMDYISPCAKVVAINDKPVEAWIFRGGFWKDNVIELLAEPLPTDLTVEGRRVVLKIEQFAEGELAMPPVPLADFGRA
jgi:hypothetical protein